MLARLWWIVHKDLTCEWRTRRAWPAMLLLGLVVALVFSLGTDLPGDQRRQVLGSLLWLAIFFAGMIAMDRSFAVEREEGCFDGLVLCPVSPAAIYLAKLVANALALAALEVVIFPAFAVLSGVSLAGSPWALVLVAVLGNLGIAALGTLVSALGAGLRHGAATLTVLTLPLATPVVIAAAEATRLAAETSLDATFGRWVQLMAAFAVIFVTAGAVLFEYVIEE
jgi:heme exporter protein B